MEPRKASVALLYNGKNATAQVSPYLASFTYTDVSSGSSDTISVELNDRDRKWIGPWFPQCWVVYGLGSNGHTAFCS